MKTCLKCGKEKEDIQFPIDKQRKDGLHPYCKKCKSEAQGIRNKIESEARRRLPKTCHQCKKQEPEIDFPSRQSHNCWSCHEKQAQKAKQKQKKLANQKYQTKKKYIRLQCSERTENRKRLLMKDKGDTCAHCGLKVSKEWPSTCFDFHHLENKEYTIGKLIHSWASKFGKIKEELKKCILLCANCHRKLHFIEKRKELQNES